MLCKREQHGGRNSQILGDRGLEEAKYEDLALGDRLDAS